MDSTNAIGARMSANVTRMTADVAVQKGKASEHSKTLQLLSGKPLTVTTTYGAVAEGVIDRENASPEGRRKARIMSGEPPVPKSEFEGVATGKTHIYG